MTSKLMIVESPAKVKKIKSFLSNEWIVMASRGHIRDLKKGELAIDTENNFKPTYDVLKDKKKVIGELKTTLKKCKSVWLASDLDLEGEAIAYHLFKTLNLNSENTYRITFNEITKKAILASIDNPRQIDMNMFYAQQTRRILDRLIGFKVSPCLWKHIACNYKKGESLSAGRVQSVALKCVVEREKEIKKFESESYFKVTGDFIGLQNKKIELSNTDCSHTFKTKEDVKSFLKTLNKCDFKVESIIKKPSTRKPSPPFITSSLQQECSQKFGYSPKKTMLIAQKLYEGGHVTYMRTDSPCLSEKAMSEVKNKVIDVFGETYYKKTEYKSKSKNSQEAHEACRPCYIDVLDVTDKDPNMDDTHQRIYKLIWQRTMASQMSPQKCNITTIKIGITKKENKETLKEIFETKSTEIKFDGFQKIYNSEKVPNNGLEKESEKPKKKNDNIGVPDELIYVQFKANEKYTKSKHSRFNEASLIKELEKKGIGRPSTYSNIISTIQDRNYVKKDSIEGKEVSIKSYVMQNKNIDMNDSIGEDRLKIKIVGETSTIKHGADKNKMIPTEIGIIVEEFLIKEFSKIFEYGFTADVEKALDDISQGNKQWVDIVQNFYDSFKEKTHELMTTHSKEKDKHKRILGKDDKTGGEISVFIAKYGPVASIKNPNDDKDIRFSSLGNHDIKKITLEQAKKLFDYPKNLGNYNDTSVQLCKGKFGFYIKWNNKNYSIKDPNLEKDSSDENYTVQDFNPELTHLDKAVEIIKQKEELETKNTLRKITDDIIIKDGPYGKYICYKEKTNVSLYPKDIDVETLTEEKCLEFIQKKALNKSKYKGKSRYKKKK